MIGFESLALKHPLELVCFIDIAFEAQPGEHTGLALRGLAATLQEDNRSNARPMSISSKIDLMDFAVRRQRRVVRSTSSAELYGLVDTTETMLLFQITLHQIYCGTQQSPEDMIDLLEHGGLYPRSDIAVDARALHDPVAAIDVCEPQ